MSADDPVSALMSGNAPASDPWLARWAEGRIGFHLPAPHPALERWWPRLDVAPQAKVLVPLCGKSLDMRWLAAQGHPVLGIELARQACEAFVAEGVGDVSRYRLDHFECFRQGPVELWCGDFFHFHIDHVDHLDAFYDRAALIALPESTRQRYAFHLAQLLPPGARGLLISLERDTEREQGPPFHVSEAEIRRLLGANFTLEVLERRAPDDRGLRETVWALVRKGPRE
ncbi:thiopurine S-methyltransferase [Cobetia sp. 5-11-6-3]|uniref:thiopurine S-methyltransferase n=1 Tax=Cobetia sp. 5-11-6-3 TaxID=2737458 RepID=UPI00210019ED|nr:thiopurine S-methyltransferase [Cobetia sp. 5-11-6-3]